MDSDRTDDWRKFLAEFRGETDRGCALLGPALIDDELKAILLYFLIDRPPSGKLLDGPLRSLSARSSLAYALGVISTEEYESIAVLSEIRNKFAHKTMGLSFDSPSVIDLLKKLPAAKTGAKRLEEAARQRFEIAVAVLIYNLFGRKSRLTELGIAAREFNKT
jgi:mannitol operon repressor